MKASFEALDTARQYDILTAAMAEFAEHGYSKASTNRIVKRAGMSKGMLYYYFDNKQSLFDDCLDFAFDHLEENLAAKFALEVEGFIERCARVSMDKYVYFQQYPEISKFITHLYFSDELDEAQQEKREALTRNRMNMLYDKIDMDRFRDDIDRETAVKLINWTIAGYSQEMEQYFTEEGVDFENLDPYFKDFDHYLAQMRKLYYREAFQ